jgi:hypothetical protein
MLDAKLGVHTCDKCGKLMRKNQKTIIISEGKIAKSTDVLDLEALMLGMHVILNAGMGSK